MCAPSFGLGSSARILSSRAALAGSSFGVWDTNLPHKALAGREGARPVVKSGMHVGNPVDALSEGAQRVHGTLAN